MRIRDTGLIDGLGLGRYSDRRVMQGAISLRPGIKCSWNSGIPIGCDLSPSGFVVVHISHLPRLREQRLLVATLSAR